MDKAKVRKKIEGYEKQLKRHMAKFKEAEERGDVGSMNYMAREMRDYIGRMDVLKEMAMPKKKRKHLNINKPRQTKRGE